MGSRAYLIKLLQDIRASYWFLPSSLVLVAILLASGMLYLDRHADLIPVQLPKGLSNTQVDGARSLMSIISQSVFGVAGVMFSMTMVAVSFASGNFGPRLIGNFMRDRGNQWSLGILIATFVYALLITRAIQNPIEGTAFVPHYSIALALVLTFVSVITVIFFVHHIPELINVSNISAALGNRLTREIKTLIASQNSDDAKNVPIPDCEPDQVLCLTSSGYVQTLNKSHLEEIAQEKDLVIQLPCPVGAFVSEDTPALNVWGAKQDEDTCKDLRACFAIGHSRTEHQNLLFIVDQLVEMIARALSPGVNDPFTAINCLNWLYSAGLTAANHQGGLRPVKDGRVHLDPVTFQDLLETGFGASHIYAKTDELCHRHMCKLLDKMAEEIESDQNRNVLSTFRKTMEPAAT
ncbi:DUF2254 domain-containing protein [Arenibacterium sp. CAU 1754]